jgi:hypothetical protein
MIKFEMTTQYSKFWHCATKEIIHLQYLRKLSHILLLAGVEQYYEQLDLHLASK